VEDWIAMTETRFVACPHCQGHLLDDGNVESQVVACPFCDKKFQMPTAEMHAQAFADQPPEGQNAATSKTLTYVGPHATVKPWQVTTVGVLRLSSGILNIVLGLALFVFVLPLALIPLGVLEIVSAANLLSARPRFSESLQKLAIVEICAILTCAGVVPFVVGILALVWLAAPSVKRYIETLDSRVAIATVPLAP
jgi:nitrite reductase/ring-hydroxylating ferredoxin subunit